MKFSCSKCKTRYSIADDKVRDKIVKIRCKACRDIIVVSGARPSDRSVRPSSRAPALSTSLDHAFNSAFSGSASTGSSRASFTGGSAPALKLVAQDANPEAGMAPAQRLPQSWSDPAYEASNEFENEQTHAAASPFHLPPPPVEDEWYLAIEGHQFGPMLFSELCSRVKRGETRGPTGDEAYVWRDGFDDWVAVTQVPELRPYTPPRPPGRPRSGLLTMDGADHIESTLGQVRGRAPTGQSHAAITSAAALPAEVDFTAQRAPVSTQAPPSDVVEPPHVRSSFAAPIPSAPLPATMGAPQIAVHPPGLFGPESNTHAGVSASGAASGGAMAAGGTNLAPVSSAAIPVQAAPSAGQAPVPASAPVTPKMPPMVKVAVACGIITLLLGIALIAVSFFGLNRDQTPTAAAQPPPVGQPESTVAEPSITSAVTEPEDPGEAEETFAPEEVQASATPRTTRKAKRGSSKSAASRADKNKTQEALFPGGIAGGSDKLPNVPTARRAPKRVNRESMASEVKSLLTRHGNKLRTCYERALKYDPNLKTGRLDVTITVPASGRVSRVRVGGTSSGSRLSKCIKVHIMRDWRFRKLSGVGSDEAAFPLILQGH